MPLAVIKTAGGIYCYIRFIIFKEDNADVGHGNIWGGVKVTNYMGKVLKEQFGIEDGTDWQWEETKEYYKKILEQERTKN